jgi:hypothetical protein
MITIKTMKQIPTSKVIPSFRAGGPRTCGHDRQVDQGRRFIGYAQMLASEDLRQWRNQAWQNRIQTVQHLRSTR